jgi:hypothetical protein
MRLSTGRRVPFAALLLGAAAILASAIAPRDAAALSSKLWQPVTDGFWGVPSSWSPLGIPTGSDSAVVTSGMNGHTLTLDGDYSAAALNIQGASTVFELGGHGFTSPLLLNSGILRAGTGVPLLSGFYRSLVGGQTQIYNGVVLQAPASWQNDGHAVVHASAGSLPSEFRMVTYTTLSGTGDLLLNDAANAQITSPSGYTLTQNAGHTIHGSGRIVLPLTNHGNVVADLASNAPLNVENTSSNDGIFGASNGAHLVLSGSLNNTGGTLLSSGGDVQLNGVNLSNGTFRTFGASVIDNIAGSLVGGNIVNAGTVRVSSGTVLNWGGGTVVDSGTVLVRQASGVSLAALRLTGYVTFQGPGDIKLTDQALSALDSPSGYTITQNSGHTIHGAGKITLPATNHGLISADVFGQTLNESNVVNNDGTMDARNGGVLLLQGTTVNNSGTVTTNGGDVQLDGATINGGALNASGGNVVAAVSGSQLSGNISHTGTLQVNSGAILNVNSGTFTNTGNVLIKQPAGASLATLRLNGYTTFTGGGAIQLSNPTLSVFDSPSGYTATQAVGHTTHGTGVISLPFANHGLVSADAAGQTLTQSSNSITNDGTLQATSGGTYVLANASVSNAGGFIKANGGNVQLNASLVSGGTLLRTGSSYIEVTNNSTLSDVTHTGLLRVNSNKVLTLIGTTTTNTGTIQVRETGGNAAAALQVQSYVTLAGTGNVLLTDAAQSSIISPSGYTLTQAATHSILGTGQTALPTVNHGLVNANVSGQPLTMSNTIVNDGTLTATNGGKLVLNNATLSSTGTVLANGGDVFAHNSDLQANAFATTGGSRVILDGANTVNGIVNKGAMQVNGATIQSFNNAFTDSGTITIRDTTAGAADMRISNYVTVNGNGTIRLTHGQDALIESPFGYSFTQAAGHTIRGTGKIGVIYVNQGDTWADVADSTLLISSSSTNSGVYGAMNGGSLRVTGALSNLAVNTLNGGAWRVGANSRIRLPGFSWIVNHADVTLQGINSAIVSDILLGDLAPSLQANFSDGSFTLRNNRDFTPVGSFVNQGRLVLGDSSDFAVNASPSNTFVQTSGARMVFELAGHGTTRCGHLVVPGFAGFDGSLTVRLANGFVPAIGDSFLVIDFGTRGPGFASYDSLNVAPGVYMAPVWRSHQLWLRAVNQPNVGVGDPPSGGPVAHLPKFLRFGARSGAGMQAELQLDLPTSADVEVSLFDITGRRVMQIADGAMSAGSHAWPMESISGAPAGVYFARARVTNATGSQTFHTRVVTWR